MENKFDIPDRDLTPSEDFDISALEDFLNSIQGEEESVQEPAQEPLWEDVQEPYVPAKEPVTEKAKIHKFVPKINLDFKNNRLFRLIAVAVAVVLVIVMLFAIRGCGKSRNKECNLFNKNLAIITDSYGKKGFINENGEEVIKTEFDYVDDFADNGLALVGMSDKMNNTKYGFVNKNGEYIITPEFDAAYSFDENGLARVKVDGKFGFIDDD